MKKLLLPLIFITTLASAQDNQVNHEQLRMQNVNKAFYCATGALASAGVNRLSNHIMEKILQLTEKHGYNSANIHISVSSAPMDKIAAASVLTTSIFTLASMYYLIKAAYHRLQIETKE
jgi:hypothetical protein